MAAIYIIYLKGKVQDLTKRSLSFIATRYVPGGFVYALTHQCSLTPLIESELISIVKQVT